MKVLVKKESLKLNKGGGIFVGVEVRLDANVHKFCI